MFFQKFPWIMNFSSSLNLGCQSFQVIFAGSDVCPQSNWPYLEFLPGFKPFLEFSWQIYVLFWKFFHPENLTLNSGKFLFTSCEEVPQWGQWFTFWKFNVLLKMKWTRTIALYALYYCYSSMSLIILITCILDATFFTQNVTISQTHSSIKLRTQWQGELIEWVDLDSRNLQPDFLSLSKRDGMTWIFF